MNVEIPLLGIFVSNFRYYVFAAQLPNQNQKWNKYLLSASHYIREIHFLFEINMKVNISHYLRAIAEAVWPPASHFQYFNMASSSCIQNFWKFILNPIK
jgi:hypothetical protein